MPEGCEKATASALNLFNINWILYAILTCWLDKNHSLFPLQKNLKYFLHDDSVSFNYFTEDQGHTDVRKAHLML